MEVDPAVTVVTNMDVGIKLHLQAAQQQMQCSEADSEGYCETSACGSLFMATFSEWAELGGDRTDRAGVPKALQY